MPLLFILALSLLPSPLQPCPSLIFVFTLLSYSPLPSSSSPPRPRVCPYPPRRPHPGSPLLFVLLSSPFNFRWRKCILQRKDFHCRKCILQRKDALHFLAEGCIAFPLKEMHPSAEMQDFISADLISGNTSFRGISAEGNAFPLKEIHPSVEGFPLKEMHPSAEGCIAFPRKEMHPSAEMQDFISTDLISGNQIFHFRWSDQLALFCSSPLLIFALTLFCSALPSCTLALFSLTFGPCSPLLLALKLLSFALTLLSSSPSRSSSLSLLSTSPLRPLP